MFGIQIINTSNTIQIDDRYRNLAVIAKGTVALTPYFTPAYRATVPVPAGALPLVAFCPVDTSSQYITCMGVTGGEYVFLSSGGGPLSIEWFAFGFPTAPAPSGFGMQVFNELGQLTFDSRLKYMRVVDVFDHPGISGYTTRSYAVGRKYAVMMAKTGMYDYQSARDSEDRVDRFRFRGGVTWSSANTLVADFFEFDGQTLMLWDGLYPPPDTPTRRLSQMVVVDVTHY